MKLLCDECCDGPAVEELRRAGHDIVYGAEESPSASDDEVLEAAHSDDRLFITEDRDFAELVVRLKKPCRGLVLLRYPTSLRHMKGQALVALLEDTREEALREHLTTVSPGGLRRRPL